MRVGIPKALLYYYYFPLWKEFFVQLGHEVIVTGSTNKKIINQGSKISVPEICVPIKIFNGHVLELAAMNVDYIFAPRMVTVEKSKTFCPKFLGLPDMLRYTFCDPQYHFIMPYICSKKEWGADVKELVKDPFLSQYSENQLREAWEAGVKKWQKFQAICRLGYTIDEAMVLYQKEGLPPQKEKNQDISIAVIGYVYEVYDQFVGMEITKRLEALGVNIYTFEMLELEDLKKQLKAMEKTLFWTFANKVFAAGLHYYHQPGIDGIIHVTAFGCGPDSLSGKMMELDSDKYGKPFLTIRVDEHTGESHLQTRIEAFTDMIRRKKLAKK